MERRGRSRKLPPLLVVWDGLLTDPPMTAMDSPAGYARIDRLWLSVTYGEAESPFSLFRASVPSAESRRFSESLWVLSPAIMFAAGAYFLQKMLELRCRLLTGNPSLYFEGSGSPDVTHFEPEVNR